MQHVSLAGCRSAGRVPTVAAMVCLILAATVLVVGGGCREVNPFTSETFLRVDIPERQLRSVDPLDLGGMAAPAAAAADADGTAGDGEPGPLTPEQILPDREGDEVGLTLAECRVLALQGNLDLKVQLLAPTIAAESITEEEARFESLFFSNVENSSSDVPTASTLTGSQVDRFSADLGVRIPLRTGGTITFDHPITRFKTNNQFSTLNPSYTADFSVSLSQPLLRGAGVRTNTHGIRVAHYQTQRAEARSKLEVIRVLTSVDRVYWRLYAARSALEVRIQEYELAMEQLKRAQRRVRAQVAAEVEITRAESGLADRIEAIIVADNALRDRERDLKRILNQAGLELGGPAILIPVTQPDPLHYLLDADQLADAAVETRMEMLELQLQLAQDVSTIDLQRNQALPLVDFTYTYNINGLGGVLGDAFDQLVDRSFEDHRVGLRFEVPLGNSAARARLRRSLLSRLQTLASRRQREIQIRQEVYNAVDQLEANWQRVLASRQSVILADRTQRAEQRQFELGMRTSTDVLDAQASFAAARLAEIRALAEYQIAQVDIAFATGTVLGASRVDWVPAGPDLSLALPK